MSERRSEWRALLDELGVRPSKSKGQNFLHDLAIVRRIAEAAEIATGELVVEIGPGLGALTRELAARADRVIAVELDRRLAAHLAGAGITGVEVIEADILATDIAELTRGRPYVVVANLPYNIATAVIEHLLAGPARPQRLLVMVQREVAERIVAQPPKMSILAVAVQFYGTPRIVMRIGPGAFIPAPKVESAVLRIDVAPQPPLPAPEQPAFFRLVRAGFGQRRKQLANALAAGLRASKEAVERALLDAGVAPERRAETLTIADWLRLYHAAAPLLDNGAGG
ncbi:MAG TPA: 16S rRNA (adenine(1518)-N(6)/adenine(1519)-N(6))-dimethyltransferase RsmA [Thermomicrobiaceae bacterium]|nr:16S rRNA (adenine(1518)-N(6)/adenine(1519)-N(6))-dimethyltransferase RsmA [Thermomicrobiaceae bacterium]